MAFTPVEIATVELKNFKDNVKAVKYYVEAKKLLMDSGLVNLLRIFSRPYTRDGGRDQNAAAYKAAYTEGYNDALDDLIYFQEKYLVQDLTKKDVHLDFGSKKLAVDKHKDMTLAEYNKVTGRAN